MAKSNLSQGRPKHAKWPRRENLLHRTFNRLTAIGFVDVNKFRSARWLWRCTCGALRIIVASNVKGGHAKSCGCLERETTTAARRARRITHGGRTRPEYRVWNAMRGRCENPTDHAYRHYGGRGILVCERWRKFANFFADMGERPSGMTLERIDNDKGYSPDNCKWATRIEQANNTRRNRMLTLNGQTMNVSDWARHLGIPYGRLNTRLNELGWSEERALTTPPIVKYRVRGKKS